MSDTKHDDLTASMMEAALAGLLTQQTSDIITGDEVEFHDGAAIVLPHGMTYKKARRTLDRLQEEAETVIESKRTYNYRPMDGAVAVSRVLKRMFGIVIGAGTPGFFGVTPPETRSVQVGLNETVDVPWGTIEIPALDRTMATVAAVGHSEHGPITYVEFSSPKKNKALATEFLEAVEAELKSNSIYRGKAIVGTSEPEFLDLSSVKPGEIVFSQSVMNSLEGGLWSVIRHREVLKGEGVRIKRAMLLEGPYGTGKTSAGLLTALEAVDNGWTFISARPGRDDISEVLRTARLYQPAVVFLEDIDSSASVSDDKAVSRLLETFDGVTSKGAELAVVMTTNSLETIHKGMLRPGRIDDVVTVAGLDRAGVEKLVRAVVPADRLDPGVNYDAVYEAMGIEHEGQFEPFLPAFVRESCERAKTFAVGRLNGQVTYKLTTDDLVGAAQSLHDQLRIQMEAGTGEKKPALESVFQEIVKGELDEAKLIDRYGDQMGHVSTATK